MNNRRKLFPLWLALLTGLLTACGGGSAPQLMRGPEGVVFLSKDYQQLMLAPDDASQPTRVLSGTPFTDIKTFRVSPNGQYVAYMADQTTSGQYDLYVSSITGGSPVKVSQLSQGSDNVMDFAWSPDSSRLAYRADYNIDNRYELFMVNTDGQDYYRVADLTGWITSVFVSANYAWSPDSQYLAYTLDDPTYRYFALYSHLASSMTTDTVSDPLHRASDELHDEILSFKWSPDSQQLAFRTDEFSTLDNQYEIFVMAPDGSNAATRANGTAGTTAQVIEYQWSPDSRYLAEAIASAANPQSLIGVNTFDLDTQASYRVANSISFGKLEWAHNSNKLAFVADYDINIGHSNNQRALLVYDADASSLVDLNSYTQANEFLDLNDFYWSPNDSRIASLSHLNGSSNQLYIVASDASSNAIHASTDTGDTIVGVNWSAGSDRLGALALDIGSPYHPGAWFMFDAAGQRIWKSDPIFTYNSSRTMKWSSDQNRAIYAAAGTTDATDILSSVSRDGSDVKLLSTTEAIAESVFETSDSF